MLPQSLAPGDAEAVKRIEMILGPFTTRRDGAVWVSHSTPPNLRGPRSSPLSGPGATRDCISTGSPPRRHHRSAFSLIEILVVVGIIAILIALTLSVLVRVRGAQRSVRCIATLRGIGEGFTAYAQDHKGRYPDPGRANLSWEQMLLRYHKGSFACEADTELYPAVGSSYDWRDTGRNQTSLAGRSIAESLRPEAVLAFEALPGWHARRKINVVRIDGAAQTMDDDACFRDLLTAVSSSPEPGP